MLSVTNKPFMLSIVLLNVVLLRAVILNVVTPHVWLAEIFDSFSQPRKKSFCKSKSFSEKSGCIMFEMRHDIQHDDTQENDIQHSNK